MSDILNFFANESTIFYSVISLLGIASLSELLKIDYKPGRGPAMKIFLTDIYLFAAALGPDLVKGIISISVMAILPPFLELKGVYRRSKKPFRSAIYRFIQFSPYILIAVLNHYFLPIYSNSSLMTLIVLFIFGFIAPYLNSIAATLVATIDTRRFQLGILKKSFKSLSLVLLQLPSVATGYLLNYSFFKGSLLPFFALNLTIIFNYLALKYYVLRFEEMDEIIKFLLETLHRRDEVTYSHSLRVSKLAEAIARELNLSEEDIERIKRAALLHDIGKIDIPDSVLFKPGKLTNFEYNLITFHPLIAFGIVESLGISDYVGGDYILYHHEKYIGGGYPYNKSYDSIPLGARIISVADVFDALISKRPYKDPMSLEEVMKLITSFSGIHFDPIVVSALYKMYSRGDLNFYPEIPIRDSVGEKG